MAEDLLEARHVPEEGRLLTLLPFTGNGGFEPSTLGSFLGAIWRRNNTQFGFLGAEIRGGEEVVAETKAWLRLVLIHLAPGFGLGLTKVLIYENRGRYNNLRCR